MSKSIPLHGRLSAAAGRFQTEPRPLLARAPYIGLALAALGGLVFAFVAYNVRTNGPLLAWDEPILQALHAQAIHASALVFTLMKIAGALGRETAAIISVILLVYWLWKHRWREFSLLMAGVMGGEIWFEILSRTFGRHRPVWSDPLDPLPGPGFPSGHSQTAVLLYGLLFYLLLPRLRSRVWRIVAAIITLLIMLLIGFARLYMGSHYPTDVLAGYAFGLFWGGLVYTGIELYYSRHPAEAAS